MIFKEFTENINGWSEVRKIYEQSTGEAQYDGFIVEAKEYAEAANDLLIVINAGDETQKYEIALKLEIGDMVAQAVNAAWFAKSDLSRVKRNLQGTIDDSLGFAGDDDWPRSISALYGVAASHGYTLEECMYLTWLKVKDRKGMMINGKFTKDSDLTAEQLATLD